MKRLVPLLLLAACSDFSEGLKICMMNGGCRVPWRLTAVNDSGVTLTDFPLRVTLDGGHLEGISDPATGLRFYDDDGGALPYEVDSVTGDEVEVWVRLPRLEANTTFFLLTGPDAGHANPGAVWKDFELVHHFDGALASSVDGRYGANYSNSVDAARGFIGQAPQFDGLRMTQLVSFANGELLFDGWSAFTLSWWMYLDYTQTPPGEPGFMDKGGPLSLGRVFPGSQSFQVDLHFSSAPAYLGGPAAYRRWFHVVYTFDGDLLVVYVDGVPRSEMQHSGQRLESSPLEFFLGSNNRSINGLIDELHIEKRGHTAPWVSRQSASMRGELVTITRP